MNGPVFAILLLALGIWFTVWTGRTWARGRRPLAALLGIVAAIDLGIAIGMLLR